MQTARSITGFLITLAIPAHAQITVDPMNPVSICGSPTLSVDITVSSAINAGNLFTVELSDAAGSFASPTVIGSLSGTGSGTISCAFPAGIVGGSGIAIRVLASDPPEIGAPYPLPITTVIPPNAGLNAVLTVCSNGPLVNLFMGLSGSPQAGGAWTSPTGAAVSNFFNPATDTPGCYTYTVVGDPPCANESAVVCITVNQAPNAGANGSITVCSTDAPFLLFDQLAGSPSMGGTWTFGGGPFNGAFVPGVSSPGCYTYAVLGSAPCANATATVCVVVHQPPNAGTGASVTVCSNDPPFSMFALLGGSPQGGGAWLGPSPTVAGMFNPMTMAPGIYTYNVTGIPPCANAVSAVTITAYNPPNAGVNSTLDVCANSTPVNLFAALGGSPNAGGAWTGPSPVIGGNYDPATMDPGVYTYTVVGTGPCTDATSTVTVTEVNPPNAGSSGIVNWCQSFGALDLFAQLGGTPDVGGIWTDDNATGQLVAGVFNASSVIPGSYGFTYMVNSVACGPATATLLVIVGPCLIPPREIFPTE
ncbi:MAG: hypothetical protein IPI81_08015 [Flavobacteriales bacterium]|nr:hypothetical protein [Flavobacteriales bacterium]